MKPKIILKRIFHRNEWRYAIYFDYDRKLSDLVRSISDVKWSQTNGCWYSGGDEESLKEILSVLRGSADIDISAIVSSGQEPGNKIADNLTTDKEDDNDEEHPFPEEERTGKGNTVYSTGRGKRPDFDPVLFTISEADGRLVIKFTGRYNKEWLRELNCFGRVHYDANRKEWLLRWSQLAVDSLSDYFTGQEVEVIVKKGSVPAVLKVKREERGSEIRSRELSVEARKRAELLRRYLDDRRYSKKTCEAYHSSLELFFKYFNEKDPDDITIDDISEFIDDHILSLGYSASYQNIIISAIKLYYYISDGRRVSPESLSRPRKSRALPKVLSKEEVMKVFEVTKNSKHKLILWLIYSCGLRRSEVINIKLSDLDADRGVLQIREGKGNVDRMVPIPSKVWDKIRIYQGSYKPVKWLFEGQGGGRYSVESVYSVFKQSLRLAGINKDVGVHSLRHSFATHLHEGGLDIRYIQELLGHKSTRTTEVYTHVSRRNLFAIRSPIEDMDIG